MESPLFQLIQSQLRRNKLPPYSGVVAIALLGLLLSLLTAARVRHWEQNQRQEHFERQATEIAGRLQAQVDQYAQLTRAIGAFHQTTKPSEVDAFREFSQMLLPYSEGVIGFGWSPQTSQLEQQGQSQSLGEILELNAMHTFSNPSAANHPDRQAARKRTAQQQVPVTTPLIPLETGQDGFVLYQPVMSTQTEELLGVVSFSGGSRNVLYHDPSYSSY